MAPMNRLRQEPTRWTGPTLAATALATLLLAACGGTTDEAARGQGGKEEEFEQAALKHAQCMREEGVDVPDPKPGQKGLILREGPAPGGSPEAQRRAQEACAKYLDDLPPPRLSEKQQNEMRDGAIKHAKCMREQGVDFPDPTFDAKGGAIVKIGERFDPTDPAVERANKACAEHLPGDGPGGL